MTRQVIKVPNEFLACRCGIRNSSHTKEITAMTDLNAQTFLDLPQMLVKLATKVSQQTIICGLQMKFPGFRNCIQVLNTSCFRADYAADLKCNRPRNEFGSASVIVTSTI